jgi:hypothetical protein
MSYMSYSSYSPEPLSVARARVSAVSALFLVLFAGASVGRPRSRQRRFSPLLGPIRRSLCRSSALASAPFQPSFSFYSPVFLSVARVRVSAVSSFISHHSSLII